MSELIPTPIADFNRKLYGNWCGGSIRPNNLRSTCVAVSCGLIEKVV